MSLLQHRRFLARVFRSGQRRHLLRWLGSRRAGYLVEKPSPRMTFDAIDRIAGFLRDGMRVFEYGSGGSTLFWLRWKVELVSIEHDPARFEVVKRKLPVGATLDYRLVRAGGYAAQIDAYPDAHFDLVVVDGHPDPSCPSRAAPKVRAGGLLVLDAERAQDLSGLGALLPVFRRERYEGIGPVDARRSETDVFVRAA